MVDLYKNKVIYMIISGYSLDKDLGVYWMYYFYRTTYELWGK